MLLSLSSDNTKLRKSSAANQSYRICSLHLAPADSSGNNVCPHSSASCRAACVGIATGLVTVFPRIMESRIAKTKMFFDDRKAFLEQLNREIENQQRIAEENDQILAVRLNTFSDLVWESKSLHVPQDHPTVQFWDYSKLFGRASGIPSNYAICWSITERHNDREACADLIRDGWNASLVIGQRGRGFTGPGAYSQRLPQWIDFQGMRLQTVDGDVSDFRWLDPGPTTSGRGRIVALRLKSANNLMRETALGSGFVEIVG